MCELKYNNFGHETKSTLHLYEASYNCNIRALLPQDDFAKSFPLLLVALLRRLSDNS